MRCMVAAYRSIVQYFTGKRLSWEQADELTGYKDGQAAWTLGALTKMVAMGFDIRMIEHFDYRAYAEQGEAYLRHAYPAREVDWWLAHSNIRDIQPLIPEFLKTVHWEQRRPHLQDIDDLLADGRLVFVTLNSYALNDSPGYASHALLIIDNEDGSYIAHDPGLPPHPARKIPREKLWSAMGGDANSAEVTGFKLARGLGGRLDQYVLVRMPRLSRSFAAKLITDGKVLVNGEPSKPGYKVRIDDAVAIDYDESVLDTIEPIDLPVLYEDDDCVVINKPAGVLTHTRGGFSTEGTVASWLRSKLHDGLSGERGGIVHRLDRATSGILICAKHPAALSWLQQQFANRAVQKTYFAVVSGHLPHDHAAIDMPIERDPKHPKMFHAAASGKPATTEYWVRQHNDKYSLVELHPLTGRTHQLRVHLREIGHPIIGDILYSSEPAERLYLHAARLEIVLPSGRRMVFEAPVPPEFYSKVGTRG